MTAGTLTTLLRRPVLGSAGILALLALSTGCSGFQRVHEARKVPQLGVIDPNQARELQMVSLPTYVVEPPDELEITVQPAPSDWNLGIVTVQPDGVVDLGFAGDVYVSGLTLDQIEVKIAQQLNGLAASQGRKQAEPYQVSVRLSNGNKSKFFYVLGAVRTEGRYPVTGNETVLDAMLEAGLKSNSLPEKAYLVRPHPVGAADQVLKIDWIGIRERGDTLTNYQIYPGDRLIIPGTRPPGLLQSLLGN
jgi:polysaccharide export outer membrane protein